MKDFAERLAQLMAERRLSQSDLARALDTTQSTVSRWLKGSIPNRRILADLCAALKCEPDWLLLGTGLRDAPSAIVSEPVSNIYTTRPRAGPPATDRMNAVDLVELLDLLLQSVEKSRNPEDIRKARRLIQNIREELTRTQDQN